MRGKITGLTLALAGLTMAAPLGAQVTLNPGAKVRIYAPSAGVERFQGTVITTGDTIDIARGDARVRVPAAAVTRLELSRGRSRLAGAGRGALWGGGIGLVLGAVTTGQREEYTECADSDVFNECEPMPTGTWIALNTVGGAIWGTLIGAIVGRERWDTVPVGGTRTSMTIRPWVAPRGQVGFVATLR